MGRLREGEGRVVVFETVHLNLGSTLAFLRSSQRGERFLQWVVHHGEIGSDAHFSASFAELLAWLESSDGSSDSLLLSRDPVRRSSPSPGRVARARRNITPQDDETRIELDSCYADLL